MDKKQEMKLIDDRILPSSTAKTHQSAIIDAEILSDTEIHDIDNRVLGFEIPKQIDLENLLLMREPTTRASENIFQRFAMKTPEGIYFFRSKKVYEEEKVKELMGYGDYIACLIHAGRGSRGVAISQHVDIMLRYDEIQFLDIFERGANTNEQKQRQKMLKTMEITMKKRMMQMGKPDTLSLESLEILDAEILKIQKESLEKQTSQKKLKFFSAEK